jgi:hypothetical protein
VGLLRFGIGRGGRILGEMVDYSGKDAGNHLGSVTRGIHMCHGNNMGLARAGLGWAGCMAGRDGRLS